MVEAAVDSTSADDGAAVGRIQCFWGECKVRCGGTVERMFQKDRRNLNDCEELKLFAV